MNGSESGGGRREALRFAVIPSTASGYPLQRVLQLPLLLLLAFAGSLHAQQPITLQQAVELAQKQSHQARMVTATRDAARARDHAFGARLLPQLTFTGTPQYERSIQPVIQPDGSIVFTPVQTTR